VPHAPHGVATLDTYETADDVTLCTGVQYWVCVSWTTSTGVAFSTTATSGSGALTGSAGATSRKSPRPTAIAMPANSRNELFISASLPIAFSLRALQRHPKTRWRLHPTDVEVNRWEPKEKEGRCGARARTGKP